MLFSLSPQCKCKEGSLWPEELKKREIDFSLLRSWQVLLIGINLCFQISKWAFLERMWKAHRQGRVPASLTMGVTGLAEATGRLWASWQKHRSPRQTQTPLVHFSSSKLITLLNWHFFWYSTVLKVLYTSPHPETQFNPIHALITPQCYIPSLICIRKSAALLRTYLQPKNTF